MNFWLLTFIWRKKVKKQIILEFKGNKNTQWNFGAKDYVQN